MMKKKKKNNNFIYHKPIRQIIRHKAQISMGAAGKPEPSEPATHSKHIQQVCAAEMAVRYAAVCASRKVHT